MPPLDDQAEQERWPRKLKDAVFGRVRSVSVFCTPVADYYQTFKPLLVSENPRSIWHSSWEPPLAARKLCQALHARGERGPYYAITIRLARASSDS